MNIDPLATALKEIDELKEIVESLITSSESFDYLQAKAALKELHRKGRELGRLRSRLAAQQRSAPSNIYVLDFKSSVCASTDAQR